MKVKLTPWFTPFAPPTRRGVYETKLPRVHGYSWWNGKEWSDTGRTVAEARKRRTRRGYQFKVWRGLASKP